MEKLNLNQFPVHEEGTKTVLFETEDGNNIIVEVRKTLPLAEKVEIIQNIVNQYVVAEEYYFNPLKLRTLAQILTIKASTNIEISDDEDIYALHDKLRKTHIFDKILTYTDYQEIVNWSYECAEVLCKFRSSFRGFLEEIKNNRDAENMSEQIASMVGELRDNPELANLLKVISNPAMV